MQNKIFDKIIKKRIENYQTQPKTGWESFELKLYQAQSTVSSSSQKLPRWVNKSSGILFRNVIISSLGISLFTFFAVFFYSNENFTSKSIGKSIRPFELKLVGKEIHKNNQVLHKKIFNEKHLNSNKPAKSIILQEQPYKSTPDTMRKQIIIRKKVIIKKDTVIEKKK
jgi:hypothetical protein